MPPSGAASSKSGPSQQGEKPKRTNLSTPAAPRNVPIPSQQGESSKQTTASAPVAPRNASAQAGTTRQRAPQLPRPLPPVSTQPLLSTRQMQDLLRGNRGSRVAVTVENVHVCSILRPVAKHFSRPWRQALANIHCTSVNVTVPTRAPSGNATTAPAGNAPGPSDTASAVEQEDPSPTPAERNAVTFIVQWMEQGGADPVGPNTLVYPRGSEEELIRLQSLVTALGVNPLVARTKRDIAAIRGNKCTLCKTYGHLSQTCVFCVYCKERTHVVEQCAAARESRERKKRWEEGRAQREADWARREEAKILKAQRKAAKERETKRRQETAIRKGELAVDGNDRTIPTFRSRPN